MLDPLAIRLLEERSFNAWPALETLFYDGWILRFANGYTRRPNSINPLYSSTLPLDEKIAYCEQVYMAYGQDAVFRLTDAAQPADLDAALERAGYVASEPVSVQVAEMSPLDPSLAVEPDTIQTTLTPEWIDHFCALNPAVARHRGTMTAMLSAILPKAAFATIRQEGEVVAVGLGVLERGYLGLFDILVAQPARGQGIGRRLVGSLLAWGAANGATRSYLQVVSTNVPALRLYQSYGFREHYRYWYREKAR